MIISLTCQNTYTSWLIDHVIESTPLYHVSNSNNCNWQQQIHLTNSTNTSCPLYTNFVSPRHTYIPPSGLWCNHRWNCRWLPARDSKANFCQKPECNQNIKILMSDYTAQLFKGKAVSHEDKMDFLIERKPDFLRGRCCGSYLWNSLRGAVSYPEKKWLWQSLRIVPK